jgi:fibronectin-binding autotransporter adhesin
LLSCEEIDKKTFVQFHAHFLMHFLPLKGRWPFVVGAILIGSSALYGQATSESWNVGTGSWLTGTNWLPTGPPTNTVNAFVENGGTAQIAGPGAEAATLSIGGIESLGGTVQLLSGGDLTVSTVMIGLGGTLESSGGGNTGGILHTNSIVVDGNILFDGPLDHSINSPLTVSGTGTLTMAGTGTLTISGTNTYSGGTNLDAGIIAITNDANLGTGPLDFNGGVLEALSSISSSKPITLNSGGGTFLADASTSSTLSGIISGPGALTKTGSGALTLSGTNTYGGGTNLNGGILAVSSDTNLGTGPLSFDGGTLEALSGIVSSKPITLNIGGGTFLADAGTSSTLSGDISGKGGLVKLGDGVLTLSGTNSYTGATTVSAGVLQAGSTGAFSAGSEFIVNAGATLNLNGVSSTIASLSGSGVVTSNTFEVSSIATLSVGADNTSTIFSGTLQDGSPISILGLTKVGIGTLTLTGTNTYSGGTNLNGGILAVSSDTNLGTGPLSFDGGALEALSGIVSNKPITLNTGGGTFLADAGTSSTLSGDITGKGGFVKLGDGTLTLSGTNSYTGATTVSAGVLQAGSTGAFSAGSEFIVNAGGTLDLNGFSSTIGSLSGSGVLTNTIGNATLSVGVDNASTTFGGTVTGTLSLNKVGIGTLILTGTNNYTGMTTISAGTLQVGNGGTTGSIPGNVGDNGILAFDRSDSVTFGGVISGTGSVQQIGTGTTILTGESTYTGQTTIDSGSLIVNGSIASTQTVVNPGGFLGGTGLIEGNLVNNGTVSPGNPVGTLTIGGNYAQTATGLLHIAVAGLASGQFGQLVVNGHASIAGTLDVISLSNFKFQVGEKLTLLSANGGVSGTFSSLKNPFISNTIVKAEVVVTPVTVEITGTQGSFATTPGVATTPNELAVAKALDSAAGDPRAAALFAFLNSQPLANLPHDLSLIAPTQISSMNATTVSLGKIQASNIGQRLLNIRAGSTGFSSSGFGITGGMAFDEGFAGPNGSEGKAAPPAFVPTPENRWGIFVTGTGEFTNVDSTSNAAGYNVDTGGITVGVDYRLTPNFVIGLDGSYAHSNVSLNGGGNVDVNAGTVGLYATAFANNFYLDAAASGGPNGYDTHRTALQGSASGSTDGANVNVLVAGGYDWKRGDFSIGPTATFQFSYVSINEFTETGSLAPLRIRDQSYESERTIFGAKASYNWKIGKVTLIPQVSAGWVHEYGSVAYAVIANFANGAGKSFTVNGPEIGRDGVLVDAGMSMLWSDRISTYIYYAGELARTNYSSHTVTGGIRISF